MASRAPNAAPDTWRQLLVALLLTCSPACIGPGLEPPGDGENSASRKGPSGSAASAESDAKDGQTSFGNTTTDTTSSGTGSTPMNTDPNASPGATTPSEPTSPEQSPGDDADAGS
ncbi:MAG: hypothetical protein OEZ06_29345 [Myxococcales bacterium]|nr:hypothetical protein [Myxococcales bacterium]